MKKIYITLLCMLGVAFQGNSQVSNYIFSTENNTYQELTDATVIATAQNQFGAMLDENIYTESLPFPFYFNGNQYNQVHISTDGFVFFGSFIPNENQYYFKPIPLSHPFSGIIAGFNDDLIGYFTDAQDPGTISVKTVGTAPNREYVIQWKNFTRFQATIHGGYLLGHFDINFQIRLHENGTIKSVYDVNAVGEPSEIYITAGLRGINTADFNVRTNHNVSAATWQNTVAATTVMGQAGMIFTPISAPPSNGFTYVWTPENVDVINCESVESFTMNFENMNTIELFSNHCWNRNNTDVPPFTVLNNWNGNPLPDNALRVYKGSGAGDLILVSPELTTTNGTHGISFDLESMLVVEPYNLLTGQEKIVVGTMASATDFASFIPTEFEFPLTSMGTKETTAITFPQGHKFVALKFDLQTLGNKTILIDNIKWHTALSNKKIDVSQVNLFPNPTKDILYIETDLFIKNIQLYDFSGRMLLQTEEKSIDLHALSQGNYLLTIETTDGSKGSFKVSKH